MTEPLVTTRERPKGSYLTVPEIQWTVVCPYARLAPDRGVAALVGGVVEVGLASVANRSTANKNSVAG